MRTYTLGGKLKLGDTWAQVSWLLPQQEVLLTEECRSRIAPLSVMPLVQEISRLMDTTAAVAWVPGRGGERLPPDECFQQDYLPTKQRWAGGDGRVICLQLDGRWKSHRKNPTPAEKQRLIASLEGAGCPVRALGQPMSLAECVGALASCHCFIGVDSGMMHVANSVRCPRILIRNRMFQIDTVYRGKGIMVTASAQTAVSLLASGL